MEGPIIVTTTLESAVALVDLTSSEAVVTAMAEYDTFDRTVSSPNTASARPAVIGWSKTAADMPPRPWSPRPTDSNFHSFLQP